MIGKSMVESSCFAQATLADLSSSTMNLVHKGENNTLFNASVF